jgi:rhodanese-related sulfurtransferase
MNWVIYLVICVFVVALLLLRRGRQITVEAARVLLRDGAAVIDVRTQNEFASGHLPSAINIPLDRIEAVLPGRFPDRNHALLLHCQSGMRSGMALAKLRALGYTNAFNLGGYNRASRLFAQK